MEKEFCEFFGEVLDIIVLDAKQDNSSANRNTVMREVCDSIPGVSLDTVIGYPKPSKGVKNPQPETVEAFAKRLLACTFPNRIPNDYVVEYLESAKHEDPDRFLREEKAIGYYTKKYPLVEPLVGRGELIKNSLAMLRSERVLLLWGLSGNGKTAIAIHCAHESKEEVNGIIWKTDSHSQSLTLTQLLDGILDNIHLNKLGQIDVGKKIARICDHIQTNGLKILLVIDNLSNLTEGNSDDIIDFISRHFSALVNCRTIITTQKLPKAFIKMSNEIQIKGLSKENGVILMRKTLVNVNVSDEDLEAIVEKTGGNPQILPAAASMLNSRLQTSEEILESLNDCDDLSGNPETSWFRKFYELVWAHLSTEVKTIVLATSLFPKSASFEVLKRITGLSSKKFKEARRCAYEFSLVEEYKLGA